MTRARVLTLSASLLACALVPGFGLVGCTPEASDGTNVDRTGGKGGSTGGSGGSAGRGGSGGSGGTGGSSTSGGSGGTGGSSATGGSGGTGGSSGSGGAGGSVAGSGGSGGSGGGGSGGSGGTGGATGTGGSSADAKPADAPTSSDGGGAEAGGGANSLGEAFPGRAWIRLCPKAWDKGQCCQMLCSCLPELCSDSPTDKARFGNCMSMCMGLSDQRARCQVFHCYESKNPGATKDHVSHCGHASGRVGGGSCTILDQQK